MFNRLLTALSVAALSTAAQASVFSYQEVTLGSEAVSISGSTGTINAFGVGAMFPVREQIFVTARYATGRGTVDTVVTKVNGTALGVGTHMRIGRQTDLVGGAYISTGSLGLSSGGMSTSVSAAKDTLYVGFRSVLHSDIELNGYYHVDLSGKNSTQIGVRYYFDQGLGLTAGIASSDTVQSAALGFVFAY